MSVSSLDLPRLRTLLVERGANVPAGGKYMFKWGDLRVRKDGVCQQQKAVIFRTVGGQDFDNAVQKQSVGWFSGSNLPVPDLSGFPVIERDLNAIHEKFKEVRDQLSAENEDLLASLQAMAQRTEMAGANGGKFFSFFREDATIRMRIFDREFAVHGEKLLEVSECSAGEFLVKIQRSVFDGFLARDISQEVAARGKGGPALMDIFDGTPPCFSETLCLPEGLQTPAPGQAFSHAAAR